MRVRYLTALCTMTLLLLGISPPASAAKPECPCWGGVEELTPIVATAYTVELCETHPQVNRDALVRNISAEFKGFGLPFCPGCEDLVIASAVSRPPHDGRCTLFDDRDNTWVFISDLTKRAAWSCIRDVTAVCRGQGF